ncbi:MAG: NupC/NupG family nucleoside CNT transporter [Planctomycetes bacterium]|nr:NupC/NupG family nucleoside CNT transporter [Planctomycetota bacterium]
MGRYTGLLGLAALLALAWLLSNNRRRFPWRIVGWGLCLQLGFGLIVLRTGVGYRAFRWLDGAFHKLLGFANEGADFVWKCFATGQVEGPLECFVVRVLPTIIFFSALMAVLYHLGLMQLVVRSIAWLMRFTMGTSGAETLSCSANIFVGQTEAPLMVRPFIAAMTRSELMCVMTGGFATVAGGVMALYVSWLQDQVPNIAGHLMAASIMSAPAAIVVAKILSPETEQSATAGGGRIAVEKVDANVIEALARGATDGMKLAINVAAMLIAFVAMLGLVNYLLGAAGDHVGHRLLGLPTQALSLQDLLGWLFQPLAFLMGAPWAETKDLGRLLGEKIVLTELIAYKNLADPETSGIVLSERTRLIASYALCGFANFASIGIQLGGIGGMAPERRRDLARLSLKAMAGGALASWMTACIAGVLL